MEPYPLLSAVLERIENSASEPLGIEALAAEVGLSAVHLQRIFKFAFGRPLAGYIRARKLTASLEGLLHSDLKMIDLALEHGFQHEQSYIRAFKREYGVTPKAAKSAGAIVKITPPLRLSDRNQVAGGVLFGPDIVMVPQFHLVGQLHKVPFDDSVTLPPMAAREFWAGGRARVKNAIQPHVYYGLTRIHDMRDGWSHYLPAVQAADLRHIPEGMSGDTFPASLCARFHYIGRHHYYDINVDMARKMYDAIVAYAHDPGARYATMNGSLYFERIDTSSYDGTYCQMEWFTPAVEKATL